MTKIKFPMACRWRVDFERHDGSTASKTVHSEGRIPMKRVQVQEWALDTVDKDPYLKQVLKLTAIGVN